MTAEVSEGSVQSGLLPVPPLSQSVENSMSDDFTFGKSHTVFACFIINKLVTDRPEGAKVKKPPLVCSRLLNISELKSQFHSQK